VRAIAALVGPIATTSANRHGMPTPPSAAEAAASLLSEVALVIDGGLLDNPASTVIDATASPWRSLRTGALDPEAIVAGT
ncbi:MAG TPA: Sua5/YciO/YrdC/YwlC family protein, partial [Acidimicrobiales bacterium]